MIAAPYSLLYLADLSYSYILQWGGFPSSTWRSHNPRKYITKSSIQGQDKLFFGSLLVYDLDIKEWLLI